MREGSSRRGNKEDQRKEDIITLHKILTTRRKELEGFIMLPDVLFIFGTSEVKLRRISIAE